MPGNFPSQQAGAAAKNKPPVAIIIGAVAAVVVIALAAVFFLTNRVSRSDYEEALVQTQALESSYTAINEEFSSASSATDNDSSSAYDEGKKKLKTFKQDSDKLAAMKAVKKDKDVKEKYETFEQDRAKYERYMNDLAQTMPALMKMTHTCTKLPKFDPPTCLRTIAIFPRRSKAVPPTPAIWPRFPSSPMPSMARICRKASARRRTLWIRWPI